MVRQVDNKDENPEDFDKERRQNDVSDERTNDVTSETKEKDLRKDKKNEPSESKGAEGIHHSEEGSTVAYDNLNNVEKETLSQHLRKDILKDEEPVQSCCFGFIAWIREQFGQGGVTKPMPSVLFNNLEYLTDNSEAEGLLINEGVAETADKYYKNIKDDLEIDYDADDFDIQSLARATLRYIKDNAEFFDEAIYKRVEQAYTTGNEKEFIIERIPFVMDHRDVFREILKLINSMEENRSSNKVDRDNLLKTLAPFMIFWGLGQVADPIKDEQKKEILNDLTKVDFEQVPTKFYNGRK